GRARGLRRPRRRAADHDRLLGTARCGRRGPRRILEGELLMRALTIHAAGDIRWEEAPDVEPGGDEVRLRIAYVGICGSDLHYYFHGANGAFVITEPLIPGH